MRTLYNVAIAAIDTRAEAMRADNKSVRDLMSAKDKLDESALNLIEEKHSDIFTAQNIAEAYESIAQKALVKLSRLFTAIAERDSMSSNELMYLAELLNCLKDNKSTILSTAYHAHTTAKLHKSSSTTTTQLSQVLSILKHFECCNIETVERNIHKITLDNKSELVKLLKRINK